MLRIVAKGEIMTGCVGIDGNEAYKTTALFFFTELNFEILSGGGLYTE